MTDFTAVAGRVRLDYFLAVAGSFFVVAALFIIWGARLTVTHDSYVSELGATGEPTAEWFRAALLLLVTGGSLIAWAGRRIRTLTPLLRAGTPAVSLWIGCAFFLVASQVTCTTGCPVPYGPAFTWQDFIHTSVAILAFVAACLAMLQVSFAVGHRALRRFSLTCAATVAVLAGVGGILSLVQVGTGVGGVLELAATTVALGWLAAFGVAAGRTSGVRELKQRVSTPDGLMDLALAPLYPLDHVDAGGGMVSTSLPRVWPLSRRR